MRAAGSLNDVWLLNVGEAEWIWLGGSSSVNEAGIYQSSGAMPGARYSHTMEMLSDGRIVLYAGNGYDAFSVQGMCLKVQA